MLVRLVGTAEVLGLVIGADADANQQHADKRSNDRDSRGGGQIGLAVVNGIAGLGDGDLAVLGQQHGVEDDREGHRDDVVEHRVPHADGGTLLRIVGHQGRKRLRGHVHDRVTNHVEHVGHEEHPDAEAISSISFIISSYKQQVKVSALSKDKLRLWLISLSLFFII